VITETGGQAGERKEGVKCNTSVQGWSSIQHLIIGPSALQVNCEVSEAVVEDEKNKLRLTSWI